MTSDNKKIITAAFVLALLVGSYLLLTMPDNRTPTEKVGDAIHDLDKGPDKAARQLEDRTPGQKLGDAIKDNTRPPRDLN